MISSGGLCSRRRTCRITHPSARPMPTPPTTVQMNDRVTLVMLIVPVTTASTANL